MTKPILLVEDEPIVRDSLREWLRDVGYEVAAVEDGEQALEVMGKQAFDMAVLDLKLPGKNGIQVLREAKDRLPSLKAIIMTAYPTAETAEEAIKAGALNYLVKPFSPEELERLMGEALTTRPEAASAVAVEDKKDEVAKREAGIASALKLGQDLFKKGDRAGAIKEFEKVLAVAPGNMTARTWARKARETPPRPASKEEKPKYCVYMLMGLTPYRTCTNSYGCLTCDFDRMTQERLSGGEIPALTAGQRLCRYAHRGATSYRLCSRDFRCAVCEFAQRMEDVQYCIDPEKCQACMICLRACPSGAITGGKNTMHAIDSEKCIKCGTCIETCPARFSAVVPFFGMRAPETVAAGTGVSRKRAS